MAGWRPAVLSDESCDHVVGCLQSVRWVVWVFAYSDESLAQVVLVLATTGLHGGVAVKLRHLPSENLDSACRIGDGGVFDVASLETRLGGAHGLWCRADACCCSGMSAMYAPSVLSIWLLLKAGQALSFACRSSRHSRVDAGDAVLMKAPDSSKRPYVARIEEIEATGSRGTNVRVKVRWYYRPEESMGGRRPFHGSKELFLSDHTDVQSADTIECKCNVYTFKDYTKLDAVNPEDYFSRFEYKSLTGSFVPDHIAVFCKCEMPYNPDDLMIQCDECSDWFHPACIGKTIKEAKKLENFSCESCTAENEKKVESPHESTGQSEEKQVESKRRRR